MSFGNYLKQSVFDMLLCACSAAALCYVCLIAFIATLGYQDSPFIVIVSCIALTAALFCVAYNLRTSLIGGVALAFLFGGAVIACWMQSGTPSLFDDVKGNNAYLVIEVALCCVMVFVLSRRKATAIALLVGGTVLCCAMEYLYWNGKIVATAIFVIATGALYALRAYKANLRGSDSDKLMFGPAVAVAGGLGCLSVLLALGVFALVIAPLNPPAYTLKLVTHHIQLQEVEVRGTGDQVSLLTELLKSLNVLGSKDAPADSDDVNDDKDSQQDQNQDTDQEQETGGSSFGLNEPSDKDAAEAFAINVPPYVPVLLALALIAVVFAVIFGRKAMRRKKYERICSLPPGERLCQLYLYFTKAFTKMKVKRPDSATLREYMDSAGGVYANFEKADFSESPAFAKLTESYSKCAYGRMEPSDEELDAFEEYYREFHRRAASYVGRLRYVPLFFRI
ncbi:MAG: hypothetical protein J5804_05025 [Eggerthellaceae bacterium]|nr:hypothetical protein [Eggerthellaceae bacterium]